VKGLAGGRKADGSESYTRSGSLKLSENEGLPNAEWFKSDCCDSGPITIPPDVSIAIARRYRFNCAGRLQSNAVQVIGRLKLVNPPEENLVRGDDGLFKTKDGTVADADAAVGVAGGMLENSNVSVVESMVTMINAVSNLNANASFAECGE
jgi:flagellar basal-body rod protein FlgF